MRNEMRKRWKRREKDEKRRKKNWSLYTAGIKRVNYQKFHCVNILGKHPSLQYCCNIDIEAFGKNIVILDFVHIAQPYNII